MKTCRYYDNEDAKGWCVLGFYCPYEPDEHKDQCPDYEEP